MNTQPQRHREHGDYTEKSKLRHYRRSDHNLLLREPDPGSELLTDTVRKIAEVVACQVILEVSRIEVICHIEHLKSQMRSVLVEAPGRLIVFSTCISSETNVGKRPARFRGPTKLRSSSMSENGNPVLTSRTGDHDSPY